MKLKNLTFLSQLGFWGVSVCFFSSNLLAIPRVVSTSPQITELMFQLELGTAVVGTPAGSEHPELAKSIPKIGQFLHVNLERILMQNPDWVLWDEASYQPVLENKIKSMGISSHKLFLNSPTGVFSSSQKLIALFSPQLQSQVLKRAETNWNQVRTASTLFSFIVLVWPDPAILGGADSFLYQLLEQMGGRGILPARWNQSYPKVSVEWLISQEPDWVFFLSHEDPHSDWILEKCQRWWPKGKSKCIGLSSEVFARASLTPFEHLEDITRSIGGKR